jgi:ABC-type transporter Mla MlaB component
MQAHMLRISFEEFSRQDATLHLEGHLIGPWVEELRLSCEKVLGDSKRLTLDLTAVSFVDRDGITLLRRLKTREVLITNCSAFLAHQLKDESPVI